MVTVNVSNKMETCVPVRIQNCYFFAWKNKTKEMNKINLDPLCCACAPQHIRNNQITINYQHKMDNKFELKKCR